MIIKYTDLKTKLDGSSIKYFLFYGPNSGLIEETSKKFFKNNNKDYYSYSETEVLADKKILIETIINKSFFENEKLIIINNATNKILNVIEEIHQIKNNETIVLVISSDLEKKSKLRNFFEKGKNTICVPFYEDNHQTLYLLAQKFFQENKIKISTLDINFILEKSRGNRTTLKNELEKIKSYALEKFSIKHEDIVKIVNSAENYKISELTDNCLSKNKFKTINILNENTSSVEENILIIKSFLFKLKRLKNLKKNIEILKNQDLVISSFKPTIFWKDKDIIKKQLNLLSLKEINILIKEVNKIEFLTKKNSIFSNIILNNFIMKTALKSN